MNFYFTFLDRRFFTMNIGIVSLGCAKNQVDLEEILAYLKRNGFLTVSDPSLADIIIVNTCGFIDAAKKESIDAILEMVQYQKPVVVTRCLATRYLEELKKEIPEVALWIPLEEYKNFGALFQPLVKGKQLSGEIDPTKRVFISPEREAYLRISDGCDRQLIRTDNGSGRGIQRKQYLFGKCRLQRSHFFLIQNFQSLYAVFASPLIKCPDCRTILLTKSKHQRSVSLVFYSKLSCELRHQLRSAHIQLRLQASRRRVKARMDNRRICLRRPHRHIIFFFYNADL